MNLPATSTPLPVLTVQADGLWAFAKYDVVYLKAGDEITHSGSAGKLACVRLGDELFEYPEE